MGYESSYGLTLYDINTKERISGEKFSKAASLISYTQTGPREDDSEVDSPFDDINDSWAGGYSKWYDMEESLVEASELLPEAVFVLDVSGEDQGDVYRIVANNGTIRRWDLPVIEPPTWEDILSGEDKYL